MRLSKNFLAVFILIFLGILHLSPIIFEKLYPGGTDVIGSVGGTSLMVNTAKETGEKMMWNPAIFSGMPVYYNWSSQTISLDNIISFLLNPIVPYNALFFFIGALGFYFFCRLIKADPWISLFAAIAFLFVAHSSILFQDGHFKKFRTLMLIPWVLYGFTYLSKKNTLFSMSVFAITLSLIFRQAHYQIIFYLALFLAFIASHDVLKRIKEKNEPGKFALLTFTAIVLAFLTVAQPFLPTKEYAKHSIRGAKTITETLSEKDSKDGLSYNYATSWSYPPAEYLTYIVPRVYGGESGYYYDGKNYKFRAYKQQQLPAYWGQLIFTSGTKYVGLIVLIFALFCIVIERNNLYIRYIIISLIILILLSFGKHFPLIYDLFYNHVPFFNKFRAPMMALNIVSFLLILLSVFGLKEILNKNRSAKEKINALSISSGIILTILLFLKVFGNSVLDFASSKELMQNNIQYLTFMKDLRQDLFHSDLNRSLAYLLTFLLFSALYLIGKLQKSYVYIILIISFLDLFTINQRYLTKKAGNNYIHLSNIRQLKKERFKADERDLFLLKKKRKDLQLAESRIFPLYPDFWNSNNYSYYHQSIGGYDPAKLRIYQDLIEYASEPKGSIFLSANVINMLNAKYILTATNLDNNPYYKDIKLIYKKNKQLIYQNNNTCGRAWFVGRTRLVKDPKKRFSYLNSHDFSVSESALLEEKLGNEIDQPVNDTVIVKKLSLSKIVYETSNKNSSLLVMSEIFYPDDWEAYIDGKKVKIYKTNHVLRSIIVPAGKHKISVIMKPKKLNTYIAISSITNYILLAFLFTGLLIKIQYFEGKLSDIKRFLH